MSINLTLAPSADNNLRSHTSSFCVDCMVEASIPTVISKNISVSDVFLTNLQNDQISFGFSQCVLSVHRVELTLTPGNPVIIKVDALESDDDISELIAGQYVCEVKLLIFLKTDKGFKPQTFSSSFELALKD